MRSKKQSKPAEDQKSEHSRSGGGDALTWPERPGLPGYFLGETGLL